MTTPTQISASLRRMTRDVPEAPPDRESLYTMLDVAPDASQEAIVRAYHQQARASHPDAQPDDPGAVARFKALTSAYEVLGDPARRAAYDQARVGPARGGEPRGGGRDSGEALLDPRSPRPPRPPLWAGPVRVEAPTGKQVAAAHGAQTLHHDEFAELTSLILGFLIDRWSE